MRLKMPEEKSALHTVTSAYKHWDLKNRVAKSEPQLHKEAAIRYRFSLTSAGCSTI